MPIAGKLMGIAATTMPTGPIDLSRLATHSSCFAFLSSQFGLLFGLQKRRENRLDGGKGGQFDLLLHFLQHLCALLTL